MSEIRENRDKLISMMAICEDIYRTNSRILEMLRSIMNNPGMKDNIKESVKDLVVKAQKLENINLDLPLFEEEKVLVPDPKEASRFQDDINVLEPKPKEEVNSEPELEEEPMPEPELEEESIMEAPPEEPRKPQRSRRNSQRTQRPRKNAGNQRPNRPLGGGRRAPQPSEDKQPK